MLQVLTHGGSRDSTACYPRSMIADVENKQASLIGIWGTKIGQMTRQQLRPATRSNATNQIFIFVALNRG